jgi:hypothetical protein
VNERELFEDVRDDLRDGLLVMRAIEELGLVYVHDAPGFNLYAQIDGTVYEAGTVSALSIGELTISTEMTTALRVN